MVVLIQWWGFVEMGKEKIVCGAVRFYGVGKATRNEWSTDFLCIRYEDDNIKSIRLEIENALCVDVKGEVEGFMTSSGRFVDQKEAAHIALDNDQVGKVNRLWDLFASKRSESERSKMQELIYNKTSSILCRGLKPEDLY